MGTPDLGLAAVAYGPSDVRARVGRGIGVTIEERTDYPFRQDIELVIKPDVAYAFPLQLRIPAWATNATVKLNGVAVEDVTPGAFLKLQRTWRPGDRIALHFPMTPAVTTWYRDGVSIDRGPLVFALPIGEDWRKVTEGLKHPATAPAADWEIYPTTPWNYGLLAEPGSVSGLKVDERSVGETPFSATSASGVDPRDWPEGARVAARRGIGGHPASESRDQRGARRGADARAVWGGAAAG